MSSPTANATMQKLCEMADLVIFDSPPAVTVTDAVILAARVDAIIQVVSAGTTRRDLALRGRDVLQRTGQRLLGPVLNKVKAPDLGYYYHYYYQYYTQTQPKKPATLWGLLQPARNGSATHNGKSWRNGHGTNGDYQKEADSESKLKSE